MSYRLNTFDKRLRRISRAHQKASYGYTPVVGADGLIEIRPRHQKAPFPIRNVALFVVGFLCFKAIVMASIGLAGFNDRVEILKSGTYVEQAGAWVMQADPASIWIAAQIGPFIR